MAELRETHLDLIYRVHDAIESSDRDQVCSLLISKVVSSDYVRDYCIKAESIDLLAFLEANGLVASGKAPEAYRDKLWCLKLTIKTHPLSVSQKLGDTLTLRTGLENGTFDVFNTMPSLAGRYRHEIEPYVVSLPNERQLILPIYDYSPRFDMVTFSDSGMITVPVPSAKYLVFAGNSCSRTTMESNEFIKWFVSLPHPYKIWVPGNHDYVLESTRVCADLKTNGVYVLNGESIVLDGVKFYGHPCIDYCPGSSDNAFAVSRRDMKKLVNIPADTEVLITHSPPWGVGDHNTPVTSALPEESGDLYLRSAVSGLKKLKYHIFGHISSGRGMYRLTMCDAVFVNTSTLVTVL